MPGPALSEDHSPSPLTSHLVRFAFLPPRVLPIQQMRATCSGKRRATRNATDSAAWLRPGTTPPTVIPEAAPVVDHRQGGC